MKHLVAYLYMTLVVSTSLQAQKEAVMTARGTFDVKVIPQAADDSAAGPFSRLFLDKQFHGDLEGPSKGQMLGAMSAVEGSGGYVALEMVTGTLQGKRGSFVLQHNGTMQKNVPTMLVTVVPDSGTGELAGLAGTMTIIIEGGKHSYVFEYTLGGGR
jgi:Protein of unknown function (DUF3224)